MEVSGQFVALSTTDLVTCGIFYSVLVPTDTGARVVWYAVEHHRLLCCLIEHALQRSLTFTRDSFRFRFNRTVWTLAMQHFNGNPVNHSNDLLLLGNLRMFTDILFQRNKSSLVTKLKFNGMLVIE